MNLIKLRLRLPVATIKKQVARGCGCGGILGCGVAGTATKNRDGDISWTVTSRGHYFSKWATFRGHSQRVTFRGHFW